MESPMYILSSSTFKAEEGIEYTAYGITCTVNGEVLSKVDNISTNRILVTNFVRFLTLYGLKVHRFKSALAILISLGSDMLEELGLYEEKG